MSFILCVHWASVRLCLRVIRVVHSIPSVLLMFRGVKLQVSTDWIAVTLFTPLDADCSIRLVTRWFASGSNSATLSFTNGSEWFFFPAVFVGKHASFRVSPWLVFPEARVGRSHWHPVDFHFLFPCFIFDFSPPFFPLFCFMYVQLFGVRQDCHAETF